MIWYWIVFTIFSCIAAKISLLSSQHGGKWFFLIWFIYIVPFFPLLTIWSKNLLIDSLVYDFIILFTYTGIYIASGVSKSFSLVQYIGLTLTILGFIMMKIR